MATFTSTYDAAVAAREAREADEARANRDDRTRIKDAFKVMRKHGYACRMNYECCGSCASAALHAKYGDEKPVVFWNRQSDAAFDWRTHYWQPQDKCGDLNNNLYLSWSGDSDFICNALEAEGLTVERPEHDGYCIVVRPTNPNAADYPNA